MKLIPYFSTQKKQNTFTVGRLSVFLAHAGKAVWSTDEPGIVSRDVLIQEYCEPNGFVVNDIFIEKDIAFVHVNPKKMNLSDFYTWEEALTKPGRPECWREYYFVQDKEGSDWWSPKGLIEAEIQGYGNVYDLWRHLRTLS